MAEENRNTSDLSSSIVPGLSSLDEWCAWLLPRFNPTTFLTLTFDEKLVKDVTVDRAYWFFARLVEALNADMLGKNYRGKCKHSYFSYLVSHEYHVKGNVHLHALIDNWVDYALIHRWWNAHCGFAWTATIPNTDPRKKLKAVHRLKTESMSAALRYVLKYVLKSSVTPRIWITNKRWEVGPVRIVRMPDPPALVYPSAKIERAMKIANTLNYERLGF